MTGTIPTFPIFGYWVEWYPICTHGTVLPRRSIAPNFSGSTYPSPLTQEHIFLSLFSTITESFRAIICCTGKNNLPLDVVRVIRSYSCCGGGTPQIRPMTDDEAQQAIEWVVRYLGLIEGDIIAICDVRR